VCPFAATGAIEFALERQKAVKQSCQAALTQLELRAFMTLPSVRVDCAANFLILLVLNFPKPGLLLSREQTGSMSVSPMKRIKPKKPL
jgi:hypothetical protein